MNRLLGLEIDEVSFVDRPANQHGLVAITKRDTGDTMDLFDEAGNLLDPDELEPGMSVYDADGQRRVLLDEETAAALEAEGVDLEDTDEIEAVLAELGGVPDDASELEGELAGVGKAAPSWITGGAHTAYQAGQKLKTKTLGSVQGRGAGPSLGRRAQLGALRGSMQTRAAISRRPVAAVAGAGAVGYGSGRVKKNDVRSLGNTLLADLSKAYTDGERDRVVSKAYEEVTEVAKAAQRRAERAEAVAKALVEREELATFTEIAKSYELPVDADDLGPILQTIAKSGLNEAQLDLVDRLFHAAGEAIYAEQGFTGRNESGIMEVIGGEALELVGKSAGDFTPEQAAVAIMASNPAAYEDYLYEQRG